MEKKANEQRHADLKRDADKLLQLSTELKDFVDKSNENVLSVDVVRKAEEIEKLAHNVKTKMLCDNLVSFAASWHSDISSDNLLQLGFNLRRSIPCPCRKLRLPDACSLN